MFTVEIFGDGEWKQASSHTLLQDAENQKERFMASGILEENLRIKEK